VTLSPVTRDTGEPSYIGAPDFILEAFRAGTEPRLGDLSSTIRVGGGRDSFFGSGVGYDDEEETEFDSSELDKEEDEDRKIKPLGEASEDLTDETEAEVENNAAENGQDDKPEGDVSETDNPDLTPPAVDEDVPTAEPAVVPVLPKKTPPPAPKPEPEEDELEDGLY